jgi:4-amino-4-deoxy-L-arabinose transferase-like glycosyltransferase
LGQSEVKSRNAINWPTFVVELAVLLIATWFALHLNPTGFGGGPFDDQRYFDAARQWIAHPPLIGKTHWELRHTLILPLMVLFRLKGETIATGMILPLAAALAFAAINFVAIRQAANSRAAWIWAGIFLTTPLFLRIGTSIFPEIIELLFTSAALWALWFGRQARHPARLFALSGLCAALAIMTRETASWLLIVYAFCVVFRPGVRRSQYGWALLFGASPLLVEWAWLVRETGDPLYRLQIGMRHVLIPSAHMVGQTVHVDHVLLNPAVARAWVPPGLFHIHWALNPVLGLFADAKYGLAIWGAILFALVPARRGARRGSGRSALMVPLLLIALLGFVFATYVLMISQDQRYYAVTLCCIALIAALLGDRLWAGRRMTVVIVTSMILVSNIVLSLQFQRFDDVASVSMPLIRKTAGPIFTNATVAGELRQPLAEAALPGRIVTGTPTPGGLSLIVESNQRDCAVPLHAGQLLVDCRLSSRPALLRWIHDHVPQMPLPAKLTGGATRAALIRLTAPPGTRTAPKSGPAPDRFHSRR